MTTAPVDTTHAPAAPASQHIGRLERPAMLGVLVREFINYSSFWRSSAFSSIVEPVIYLLAFGFGLGALVDQVGDFSYLDFVATGTVGMAVLYSSAFPAMFGTFVKYKFQRTYDAILAAPVDSEELVTAEALWLGTRTGVFGCAPVVVAMFFGLDPSWGMFALPLVCFLGGLGWALFGIMVSATLNSIDNFSYVMSGILTPLMLTAGTFFPVEQLPDWGRVLAQANPLYHCVELVRGAVFGWDGISELGHVAFLLAWTFLLWRIAIRQMTRRLVD
ncbi:MAG: transporter [Thermoleophilia bacterium]|jgi:lipooligosaccharide transport system permease protein|nr:transporter [Thermoleophilia bacterium]